MKLETDLLNTADIQSINTQRKIKVRLSDNAQMMIFRSYTKNLYSNIIGSIIRELTSNCYDSHVAAGVKYPIIIRLNKESTGYTISFIDKGTGMSPQTIEEVYGVLFESTKRQTNEQFGAFGIGSKTPLAYDTQSFFVKTRVDGIEYFYNIYAGETSPEIELIKQTETTERNGTEVKVTIASGDLGRFLSEIKKQLYYFDNIIFEGFDHHMPNINNYTIHHGNTFLYRGSDLYDNIHICLGHVAYPIDYNALGLYAPDWQVPVAIKANIGDINVTMNREAVEYSDETIEFLKNKLHEVRQELIDLYVAQCGDIKTITDYLKFKQKQFELKITPTNSIFLGKIFSNQDKISLTKFPYNNIKSTIKNESLVLIFYSYKLYGIKPNKFSNNSTIFNGSYFDILTKENIFRTGLNFNSKLIKQTYLKHKYECFYILKPKYDYSNKDNIIIAYLKHVNCDVKSLTSAIENEIIALFNELTNIIKVHVKAYDDIVVPDEFFCNKNITKKILKKSNSTISVLTTNFTSNRFHHKIKISELTTFKGNIFYGFKNDAHELNFSKKIFASLFNSKYIATLNNLNDKEKNIINMYNDIAKKLLHEELERIKLRPKYYCDLYEWSKLDEHAHKFVNRLVVREQAVTKLASIIERDHTLHGKWKDVDDNSLCVYDEMMIGEYIDEILKDFTYQMKSYTIGIPLFEF